MKREFSGKEGFEIIRFDVYEELGCLYARVEFIAKSKSRLERHVIPKMDLNISVRNKHILLNHAIEYGDIGNVNFDDFSQYNTLKTDISDETNKDGIPLGNMRDEIIADWFMEILEEYPLEITIKDIENKFGRRIKIVSEKEN